MIGSSRSTRGVTLSTSSRPSESAPLKGSWPTPRSSWAGFRGSSRTRSSPGPAAATRRTATARRPAPATPAPSSAATGSTTTATGAPTATTPTATRTPHRGRLRRAAVRHRGVLRDGSVSLPPDLGDHSVTIAVPLLAHPYRWLLFFGTVYLVGLTGATGPRFADGSVAGGLVIAFGREKASNVLPGQEPFRTRDRPALPCRCDCGSWQLYERTLGGPRLLDLSAPTPTSSRSRGAADVTREGATPRPGTPPCEG